MDNQNNHPQPDEGRLPENVTEDLEFQLDEDFVAQLQSEEPLPDDELLLPAEETQLAPETEAEVLPYEALCGESEDTAAIPSGDNWLDEILGSQESSDELGLDEQAIADIDLVRPEEAELEQIVQQTLQEMEAEAQSESNQETDATQLFVPPETGAEPQVEEPQEETREKPQVEAPQEEAQQENPAPKRKRRPRMKQGYGLFGIPHILATGVWLAIILAIGIYLGRIVWLCAEDVLALGKEPQKVTVTIEQTDDLEAIAQKLKLAGMIRYPKLFQQFAELTDKAGDIMPGTYTFNERLGVDEKFEGWAYDYNALIRAMRDYGEVQDTVTILFPEGSNCAQIFAILEENGVCTVEELENYAAEGELDDYWFLEGIERGHKYCLEGYICTDTYDFYTNDEPKRVLEKFLDEFDDRFTDRLSQKYVELNQMLSQKMASHGYSSDYIAQHQMTLHDVVVLASIIEKETSSNLESFEIASVFYNRLAHLSEYPHLNVGSTMKYALEYYYKGELNTDEALENCEFNTDVVEGLVDKPICNPSLNSMAAALGPKDTDYYYFIYDDIEKCHRFTTTHSAYLEWREQLGYDDE